MLLFLYVDSWRKLVAQAQAKAMYRGKVLVLSKCEKYWYSKDTAGHGGSYVKVYKNRGNTLEFLHAADENLKPISSKHESHAGEIIKKCDLNMKRQK